MSQVCPTCRAPLRSGVGSRTLLSCEQCQQSYVPSGAQEVDLVGRTVQGADPEPFARINLSPEFRARFELGRVMGSGSSGMVCQAMDRNMDREVAIKFLMLRDESAIERFLREGQSMGRIRHPNVVAVYTLDVTAGQPYMVMELVSGETLRARMARLGKLSGRVAVELMMECLSGLSACHEVGLVHRDLKPENIIFDGDGHPKIADLGIVKDQANGAMTAAGAVIGTPRYIAPEQIAGTGVDFTADVYAMGVILYEMLTGQPPFPQQSLSALFAKIAASEYRSLNEYPEVGTDLAKVVHRAMTKDPRERTPSADAMRAQLSAIREPTGRHRGPRPGSGGGLANRPVTSARSATNVKRLKSRSRSFAGIGVSLVLILVCFSTGALLIREPRRLPAVPVVHVSPVAKSEPLGHGHLDSLNRKLQQRRHAIFDQLAMIRRVDSQSGNSNEPEAVRFLPVGNDSCAVLQPVIQMLEDRYANDNDRPHAERCLLARARALEWVCQSVLTPFEQAHPMTIKWNAVTDIATLQDEYSNRDRAELEVEGRRLSRCHHLVQAVVTVEAPGYGSGLGPLLTDLSVLAESISLRKFLESERANKTKNASELVYDWPTVATRANAHPREIRTDVARVVFMVDSCFRRWGFLRENGTPDSALVDSDLAQFREVQFRELSAELDELRKSLPRLDAELGSFQLYVECALQNGGSSSQSCLAQLDRI